MLLSTHANHHQSDSSLLSIAPPSPSPTQQPQQQQISWIVSARLILGILLIYYHNNRIFDSYRHNLEIRPFALEQADMHWYRELLYSLQRLVLQAGLNLFMALAGASMLLSLRRRSVVAVLSERSIKLLVSYLFGVVTIAATSNEIIAMCTGTSVGTVNNALHFVAAPESSGMLSVVWHHLLSMVSFVVGLLLNMPAHLLSPGHLAYLPYLFAVSVALMPMLRLMIDMHQRAQVLWNTDFTRPTATTTTAVGVFGGDGGLHHLPPLAAVDYVACVLYAVSMVYFVIGYYHLLLAVVSVLGLLFVKHLLDSLFGQRPRASKRHDRRSVGIVGTVATTAVTTGRQVLGACRASVDHMRMLSASTSTTIVMLVASGLWFVGFFVNVALVDYQLSLVALYLIYVAPCLLLMLPTRISFVRSAQSHDNQAMSSVHSRSAERPWLGAIPLLDYILPCDSLNTPLLAILCIIAGQVLFISYPSVQPVFDTDRDTSGMQHNIVQLLLQGVLPRRKLSGLLVMAVSHSSFFLLGFLWLLLEPQLPSIPTHNAFGVVVCIAAMLVAPLLLSGMAKGFFYLTAGFVTYHSQNNRFWYHLGSWVWVWGCIIVCKHFANVPYDIGNTRLDRALRVARDITFATFLCHPLWGYVVGCYLLSKPWSWVNKWLVLQALVYLLSVLWSLALLRNPLVASMFGVAANKSKVSAHHRSLDT
jgi:hypothetical protein